MRTMFVFEREPHGSIVQLMTKNYNVFTNRGPNLTMKATDTMPLLCIWLCRYCSRWSLDRRNNEDGRPGTIGRLRLITEAENSETGVRDAR